ncbi:MAG TPA: HlyD family secretion protein [Gemmatimonadales bacterium]|nr:HlyD family secretion protein [Gemmatimonadales bacterium]
MTATLPTDEIAPRATTPPRTPEGPTAPASAPRGSRVPLILLALFLVLGGGWALRAWLFGRTHVSTDNAQVDGHITPVAPKVGGFVTRVAVEENQPVSEGDTLVVLDPKDATARLLEAVANLAQARSLAGSNSRAGQMQAQVAGSRANAAGAQATVVSAEASLRKAEADVARARQLATTQVVSAQQLDAAEAAYAVAAAQLEAARRQAGAATEQVTASMAALQGADARLAAAEAAVETARLQLGYTTVLSPSDGIVARRKVEPGELVQPGQTLMTVVPTADVWVTANLKETEIEDVTPGDSATFRVDAYPGHTFRGAVVSLSPATGARFALLPPDNATGNFTKVVQRVPVRIAVAPEPTGAYPLRPGLSADVTIRTR